MTTHSPNTPEPQTTPLAARIRLAHAYFQRIADMHSIDILHVKGYAFSQEIYRKGRYSSDADLLVRPSHVDRFVEILMADGWRIQAHFETGSVFEHAMTLYHASWGLTDIHRFFPGLGRHGDYEKAFDRIWAARKTRMIAHRPCTVPSDLDARLLVVLHRARAASRYSADINYLVSLLSYSDWQRLRARAEELDSSLAYSAAMGGLEQYRDDRDYLLWLSVSQDVPHYIQWIGRLQSATTLHDKLRTLKNIFFYVLASKAASVGIHLIQWTDLENDFVLGTLSLWGWLLVMFLFSSIIGFILNKFNNQKIVLIVTTTSLGGIFALFGIFARSEVVNNFLDRMIQYNIPLSYMMIAICVLLLYVVIRHHESKEVGVGM